MSYDLHKNFAYSTVATAPSPATSGISLVVQSGDGSKFPTPPFNATVWPAGNQPTIANAEIVRVTGISTDTLTITRAQESTSARSIIVGDQIAAAETVKTFTDIETSITNINESASYVVYISGSNYLAVNGTTHAIDYTNTDIGILLNNLLSALSSTGGKIFIREGTYTQATLVNTLISNVVIEGSGQGTVIKLGNSANIQMINSTASFSNVTFRDITFDGNGSNQSDGAARDDRDLFSLINITNLNFINCLIQNGRHGAQLRLSVCNYTSIINCRAYNMGLTNTFACDAFFIRNSTHYRAIGNTVLGGTNPDTGFAQDGVDHSVVSNNTIEAMNSGVTSSMSNTEGSSSAASSSNNVIANNAIKGQGGGSGTSVGIKVSSYGNTGSGNIHDVEVIGNIIDNCDRSMWLEQVDRLNVLGNIVHDAAGANGQLILLSTTGTMNDLTLRGNKLYNTTNRGISFDSGSFGGRTIIEDNDFITVSTPIGGTIPSGAIIRNNPGYNPQGAASISVGSSPFTYTAGPTPETVYIRGGTVSLIVKNSVTLFTATEKSINLEPNEAVVVTYSSTPTMNKDMH